MQKVWNENNWIFHECEHEKISLKVSSSIYIQLQMIKNGRHIPCLQSVCKKGTHTLMGYCNRKENYGSRELSRKSFPWEILEVEDSLVHEYDWEHFQNETNACRDNKENEKMTYPSIWRKTISNSFRIEDEEGPAKYQMEYSNNHRDKSVLYNQRRFLRFAELFRWLQNRTHQIVIPYTTIFTTVSSSHRQDCAWRATVNTTKTAVELIMI